MPRLRYLIPLSPSWYIFLFRFQKLCNHLNFRHKMAQYAARDSIDLHCQVMQLLRHFSASELWRSPVQRSKIMLTLTLTLTLSFYLVTNDLLAAVFPRKSRNWGGGVCSICSQECPSSSDPKVRAGGNSFHGQTISSYLQPRGAVL